jgi:phage-related protein
MPVTPTILFQEADGTVPLLEWFDTLPPRSLAKCRVKIERLQELGFELRRPEADYLRDGIYELRIGLEGINYRILYFFWSTKAIVISHGLKKERIVSANEIDQALKRKRLFELNPKLHTYEG